MAYCTILWAICFIAAMLCELLVVGTGSGRRQSTARRPNRRSTTRTAAANKGISTDVKLSTTFMKRVPKEFMRAKADPMEGITVDLYSDAYYLAWKAKMTGPPNSPYKGGIFHLHVELSPDYPVYAPTIQFLTKVYHPNISKEGAVCIDVLKENWFPTNTIMQVLNAIRMMLTDANPDDPLEKEIAHEYKEDRAKFEKTAREWTRKYATADQEF